MIKVIHLLHKGDAYEISVYTDSFEVQQIWKYPGNETRRPIPVAFSDLDHELKAKIENRIIHAN